MTRRGSRRSALRDRAPPLRAAPEARRWSTPRSSTVVWGPVFPGGLCGIPPPNWDPEYPLRRPRTFPPGRNPPNRPGIGECDPGVWNREVLAPGISPPPPLRWAGGLHPRAAPRVPPRDHQRVSEARHEKWEKCDND